jgi:hypothetical protein
MSRIAIILMFLLITGGCKDRSSRSDESRNMEGRRNSTLQVKTPRASAIFGKVIADRPIDVPQVLVQNQACALDTINDETAGLITEITDKAKLKLAGWATDPGADSSYPTVYLEIDGPVKAFVAAIRWLKRRDVAEHFNKPELVDSGWESFADFSDIPGGVYKVRVIQVNGQFGSLCDTKRSIHVD